MCSRTSSKSIVASAVLALSVTAFFPTAASADLWHDSFVFDACEQRAFVEVDHFGTKMTVPFVRQRHAVKAGTPVSLTIRYPKLFTAYRVLVEALEVPDALPRIRGTGQLPSIDMGEQALPDTKGAQDINTIEIQPVTVESVLRGFLTRESATQLILRIQTDRQKVVDGTRTVATDLRELHEALGPVLGEGPAGPPHDRVPSLTTALRDLRGKLDVPPKDFCRLSRTNKSSEIADADRRRKIREWVASTDRLAEDHRRIGRRWQSLGVDGLLDRVIRDVEDLDTRMNQFLDNLRAHTAALELLHELIRENGGPRLSRATLRDRWVLDFALRLRREYSDLRTSEEFRAIAERFEAELAEEDARDPHVEWLKQFARELRKEIEESAALVGTTTAEACRRECDGGSAMKILLDAREQLQKAIDLASVGGCCMQGAPGLRRAIHTTAARVIAARSATERELSRLNRKAARLFEGINMILAHSRTSEIRLSLGVHNTNSVVTYRVFEEVPPERYAVVPAAAPETFSLPQGGGVRPGESGATTADVPGEGFRSLGEEIFEVHRTYRVAAFGAFTWSPLKTPIYKVRELEHETGVARRVGTSTGQMSYVVGAKVHPWEPDLFPGSSHSWRRLGFLFGVPVNNMPGALVGGSWGPIGGVELMLGFHWAKYPKRDKDITFGETPLKADPDGEFSVPVHDKHKWEPFIGVSLDSNIFSSLFGTVAKIGGAI